MAVPLTLSSVPAQTPYAQYIATASQTVFPYPFEITQDSDLVVLLNGAQQGTDSGYTLTGQGTTGGGNVVFTTGLAAGTVVTFYRNISIARVTQLSQNGTFFSANFNNEFNRIYLIMQQLQQSLLPGGNQAYALMIPNSNNPAPTTLLTPGAYANKILTFDANGNPQPATLISSVTALTAAVIGSLTGPPTAAEIASGVTVTAQQYPVNNFLRYGIVPNSVGAAATNTAILKTLWNPTTGIPGAYQLPIVTGSDVWYFNASIAMHDGVYLDLNGQTMSWSYATVLADNACGCLNALRNVKIENGNITWVTTNSSGTTNYGNGLMFGGRGGTTFFGNIYDSLLSAPMGNILVKNVRLNGTASSTESRAIFMLGGLVNVTFDTVTIQGNNALLDGHYYEFGYATNPTDFNSSQSSHAHNLRYIDMVIDSCVNSGISGNGAYDVMHDGVVVTNCNNPIAWGIGEASFINPENPTDIAGAKSLIHVKNSVLSPLAAGTAGVGIVGSVGSLVATASYKPQWVASYTYSNIGDIVYNGGNLYKLLTGAPGASGSSGGPTGTALSGITDGALTWGYLNKQFSTDLLDCVVDNVKVVQTGANIGGGYGVNVNAATRMRITSLYTQGCQRGVSSSQDGTRITIEDSIIRDSTNCAIELAGVGQTGVYGSGRTSMVSIKNNWLVGNNTTGGAGAIQLTSCKGAVIEGNRFGYETAHDDVAETTQLAAVSIDTNSFNVHVRNNYVAAVTSGQAFVAASGGTTRNNRLENNSGVQTASGAWITDWTTSGSATVIASNGAFTPTNLRYIRAAPAGAVTGVILNPGLAVAGEPAQEVVIINESTGADSITFAVSSSNVANGSSCVIPGLTARRFVWDASTSLWYQQT
jgi:hypothetical protein